MPLVGYWAEGYYHRANSPAQASKMPAQEIEFLQSKI
jgi:hypothetical protein